MSECQVPPGAGREWNGMYWAKVSPLSYLSFLVSPPFPLTFIVLVLYQYFKINLFNSS